MTENHLSKEEKNIKKVQNRDLRHKIAKDIVAVRNLGIFSEGKREELIRELLAQKEVSETVCPFPNHKEYSAVWNKLTPREQKEMEENIRISTDGKIEIIKMQKKISLLTTDEHDEERIFTWGYRDRNWKTGTPWISYLSWHAAEVQTYKQNKSFISDDKDGTPQNDIVEIEKRIADFIHFFPGTTQEQKQRNLIQLLGLEKYGFWNRTNDEWDECVGSLGCIALSKMIDRGVYWIVWDDSGNISIKLFFWDNPQPYLICETI